MINRQELEAKLSTAISEWNLLNEKAMKIQEELLLRRGSILQLQEFLEQGAQAEAESEV